MVQRYVPDYHQQPLTLKDVTLLDTQITLSRNTDHYMMAAWRKVKRTLERSPEFRRARAMANKDAPYSPDSPATQVTMWFNGAIDAHDSGELLLLLHKLGYKDATYSEGVLEARKRTPQSKESTNA